MNKATLFEYAAILHPEQDDRGKDIGKAGVVVPPATILAKSSDEAQTAAARELPESCNECLDRVEIFLRPFAG